MKKLLLLFILFLNHSFASEQMAQTLIREWNQLANYVQELKPDGSIDGYTMFREFADVTLLWETSEVFQGRERIRFYQERNNGSSFAVTYHRSGIIIPERMVLRRFIGPEPTGWINHTVDLATGEYLGSQGQLPKLSTREKKLLKEWGISHF
jgi:hypothetical protein